MSGSTHPPRPPAPPRDHAPARRPPRQGGAMPFGGAGGMDEVVRHLLDIKAALSGLRPGLDSLDSLRAQLNRSGLVKTHVTVAEFAESVGRSEYRVRAWIKERRVRAVKINGVGPRSRWLIPCEELHKLLASGATG